MTNLGNSQAIAANKSLLKISLQRDFWLIAVLACFILMAWISWGKLAHPIFDTGQEAEITARLLKGELLYRDLQNYYGPLAYYANALGLLIFGQHLEVFYGVGLTLALVATLLVYRLAKVLTNAPWAALCTICVLIYCAFTTLTPGGLFNWIVPYSYGAMYATVFCLLAFTALDCYRQTNKIGWLVAAAIACGLAGLSKQEYGVAALAGVLVGANLGSPKNVRTILIRGLIVIFVSFICVFIPFALLAQQVSWEKLQMSMAPISKSHILNESGVLDVSPAKTHDIWRSTFNTFIGTSLVIGMAMIAARLFSRRNCNWGGKWIKFLVEISASIAISWIGLFLLQINFPFVYKITLAATLLVSVLALAARWLKPKWIPNYQWLQALIKLFACVTFVGLSWLLMRSFACCSNLVFHPLGNMAWLLPLLVAWFALSWRSLIRHRHASLLWALLVFSVLINARFLFYIGFYGLYAVTAILLFFTLLYHLALQTGGASAWKYLLICLLIGGSMNLSEFGQYRYAVYSNQGTIYTKYPDLAVAFNRTINYIKASGAKSVLTIPAGATLNFLTATHSPSQETIFLPGIVPTSEAEDQFIARMRKNSPELIVYVDVPFWWLKKGYQTYAEFNPLIDHWITHEHSLVYTSPKLLAFGNGKEWTIRIYAPS